MKKVISILLVVLVFVFIGCKKENKPSDPSAAVNTSTITPTHSVSPTITITPTATTTATGTFTTTPTATRTPGCVYKIGNNSEDTSNTANLSLVYAEPYTPSSTVIINTLSMTVQSATRYWIALYSDNSGEPGSMITSTGIKPAAGTGVLSGQIPEQTLTGGTQYWLVARPETNSVTYDVIPDFAHRYIEYGFNTIESGTPPPSGAAWIYETGFSMHVSASYCNNY